MNSPRMCSASTATTNNNDCIFAAPEIEETVRDPGLVGFTRKLIGRPITLQHSKLNAKPLNDTGGGEVRCHQDYAFFPHSNYDLVACLVHLDDEETDAGPLRCMPGSHKLGALSHVDPSGKFAYECTETDKIDYKSAVELSGKAGMVTFHHSLTLHHSEPKRRAGHRRFVIFQYRAFDAVQLAGVVWKCNGYQVEAGELPPASARFPDGTVVECRGRGGRLFDVGGMLAPNRGDGKTHLSQGQARSGGGMQGA